MKGLNAYGQGVIQPGGSLTGSMAHYLRRHGSLTSGMVALEHRNMQNQDDLKKIIWDMAREAKSSNELKRIQVFRQDVLNM